MRPWTFRKNLERTSTMFNKTLFSQKSVQNHFLALCGEEARKDKRTMNFIHKTAKNIETAYKIGLRDGHNGEPLAKKDQLVSTDNSADSELLRSILDFAYEAYRAGHMAGTVRRGEQI